MTLQLYTLLPLETGTEVTPPYQDPWMGRGRGCTRPRGSSLIIQLPRADVQRRGPQEHGVGARALQTHGLMGALLARQLQFREVRGVTRAVRRGFV